MYLWLNDLSCPWMITKFLLHRKIFLCYDENEISPVLHSTVNHGVWIKLYSIVSHVCVGGGVERRRGTTGTVLDPSVLNLQMTHSSGHVIWHSVSGDGVGAAILTERHWNRGARTGSCVHSKMCTFSLRQCHTKVKQKGHQQYRQPKIKIIISDYSSFRGQLRSIQKYRAQVTCDTFTDSKFYFDVCSIWLEILFLPS